MWYLHLSFSCSMFILKRMWMLIQLQTTFLELDLPCLSYLFSLSQQVYCYRPVFRATICWEACRRAAAGLPSQVCLLSDYMFAVTTLFQEQPLVDKSAATSIFLKKLPHVDKTAVTSLFFQEPPLVDTSAGVSLSPGPPLSAVISLFSGLPLAGRERPWSALVQWLTQVTNFLHSLKCIKA